ncbi:unnamed protein product [Arctogadus glacialis]
MPHFPLKVRLPKSERGSGLEWTASILRCCRKQIKTSKQLGERPRKSSWKEVRETSASESRAVFPGKLEGKLPSRDGDARGTDTVKGVTKKEKVDGRRCDRTESLYSNRGSLFPLKAFPIYSRGVRRPGGNMGAGHHLHRTAEDRGETREHTEGATKNGRITLIESKDKVALVICDHSTAKPAKKNNNMNALK